MAVALAGVGLALASTGGDAKGGANGGGASTSTSGPNGGHTSTTGSRPGADTQAPGDTEAVESPEIRRLIALGKPIYCAAPRGNEVALTFDDGPGIYTRLAIVKLRKHSIKATFFIVGRNIPLLPAALREERALGAVGDHTFTHPLLTGLAPAEAQQQIVHTKHAVERASGGPVFLFRPPYGAHDAAIDSIVRSNGLLEILWTVDSQDSLGANYAQIERTVIAGMKPGAIILMHENHGQTIRAMLNIFAALKRKHLRAVSVARLLSDDPPSDAQVRAGGLGCGVGASAGKGGG
ncbi:MAG TPA: polysaccharide deacetylase family protein [Solirubrobacteraceae bacterium]|nr:polysaccharide deacetylase family protein [Solirubrobacteraceae bacterium]